MINFIFLDSPHENISLKGFPQVGGNYAYCYSSIRHDLIYH